MNKSEAIRAAIQGSAREVVPNILAYPGGKAVFDDAGSAHEISIQSAVLGLPPGERVTPEVFRTQVAQARGIALSDLNMYSADLLLVTEEFLNSHPVCVARCTASDGRVFGMRVKAAKGLYMGAYFMIINIPEWKYAEEGNRLIDATRIKVKLEKARDVGEAWVLCGGSRSGTII